MERDVELSTSETGVEPVLNVGQDPNVVYAFTPNEWERTLGNQAVVEERTGDISTPRIRPLRQQVQDIIDTLTGREKKVIQLRFGLVDGKPRTQAETGREIGYSPRTVGRAEKSALAKLMRPSRR